MLAVAWLADAFWFEPESLTETTLDVQDPAWPSATAPLRVALLSDFHIGHLHMTPARIRTIAGRVDHPHPDVILLAGDYIGGDGLRRGDARRRANRPDNALEEEGLRALDALRAPLGTYAIMGNHDCYWDCARVRSILATTRVRLLENDAARLSRPGGDVWIEGIEDGQTQDPDFTGTDSRVPKGAASLVLTHNPGLFDWASNHASLQLSGHTHAGQVRLPLIGAIVRMSKHTEDTAKGWTIIDNRILVVTRGLGESGLPVRFGAPPQIMLLTIHPGPVAKVDKVGEAPLN
jgi:hypothetical protein